MVMWCFLGAMYMLAMVIGDVLEVFCVYFKKLYFCVVCVDDL